VRSMMGKGSPMVENVTAETKICRVKELIAELEGTAPVCQRLIYQGRVLEDDNTLGFYGVQRESTIHLVVRVGGPKLSGHHKELAIYSGAETKRQWMCPSCTFLQPDTSKCSMCGSPKPRILSPSVHRFKSAFDKTCPEVPPTAVFRWTFHSSGNTSGDNTVDTSGTFRNQIFILDTSCLPMPETIEIDVETFIEVSVVEVTVVPRQPLSKGHEYAFLINLDPRADQEPAYKAFMRSFLAAPDAGSMQLPEALVTLCLEYAAPAAQLTDPIRVLSPHNQGSIPLDDGIRWRLKCC